MMDITRWLIEDQGVEDVVAIARRGPSEVKFDRKELESVVSYLDMQALDSELQRVLPVMQEIGQDAESFMTIIRDSMRKAAPATRDTHFSLRFLSSPARILGEGDKRVCGLELEENKLTVGDDGEIRARGTGQIDVLDVDTVIFAIGDVVDPSLGLPVQYGEFVKNWQPRFPIEGVSYEAYDPNAGAAIPDVFLAGWARRPSAGLVGVARKDATNAAHAVTEYLQTIQPTTQPVIERLVDRLMRLDHPVVDKTAWMRLDAMERERARELGVETFKYGTNQQMLEVLGLVSSR